MSDEPLFPEPPDPQSRLRALSARLIRESVRKSGGEPFLAPFERGVQTLTVRIARYFKQRGFFSFETFEKAKPRQLRNRFTRHGATPFKGGYQQNRRIEPRAQPKRLPGHTSH